MRPVNEKDGKEERSPTAPEQLSLQPLLTAVAIYLPLIHHMLSIIIV